MVRCTESLVLREFECEMLLQIHDELIFEVPEKHAEDAKKVVVKCMEKSPENLVTELIIPLTASAGIGKNWADAKE